MFYFYTPWKRQKTNVAFLYPLKTPEQKGYHGGIEMEYWVKCNLVSKLRTFHDSKGDSNKHLYFVASFHATRESCCY